jgi:hypothetical protein
MALGDNAYDVSSQIIQAFDYHKVNVPLQPSQADENVPRDKFGKPTVDLQPLTVDILVSQAEETINADVSGGKPVEVLEFYALPNAVNENDEVTWNTHKFRVMLVWPIQLGGMTQLVLCHAEREIDV